MVNTKNDLEIISKIEELFPVSSWRMNGVDVWPWIRMKLNFELLPNAVQSAHTQASERENGALRELADAVESNDIIDVFVLIDSFIRIKLMDDKWYHRLTGPFHEEIQKSKLKVSNMEYSLHKVKKTPVFDESFSIENQLNYFLNSVDVNEPSYLKMFKEVKDYIEENLNTKLSCFNIGDINYETSKIKRLSEFYEYILNIKKSKLVLIVNYYNPIAYPLILAARNIGIPTVDIQHGSQSPLIYHNWDYTPSEGYNILPNYFWCWSGREAQLINEGFKNSTVHKALAGGNPWLELWKEDKKFIVSYYDKKLEEIMEEGKVNILLTLQPKYGLIGWDDNIPHWLFATIKNSPEKWKWYIRYHPAMEGKYLNEMVQCEELLSNLIKDGKVETTFATQEPLMAILRKMDVHVTPFSSSIIEAKHIGVPSVTLHDSARIYHKEEINSTWVIEARNTKQLIKYIQQQFKRKNENKLPLYKSDSIGLAKGLGILLNNEVDPKFSPIKPLIEKECYLADKRYNKIVGNSSIKRELKDSFVVGKAFEAKGNILEATQLYESYWKYLKDYLDEDKISIRELLYLKQFFEKKSSEKNKIEVENFIRNLIRKFESKKTYLFRILFLSNDFKELKIWIDKVEHNLDTLFYVGRILIDNSEIEKGIEVMNRFLNVFDSNDELHTQRTFTKEYKISVLYYIGVGFFKLNCYEEASSRFLQCIELSNDSHEGAKEHLLKLKNMNTTLS
ncbi:hypothetical protein [Psychrobacillus sp. FSL K6-1415]|uniref:hypothetical protein n=1 Tax=Psychrobacillus sp. FSL K6-1415 TaxID=2921544 RepID=UPI0030F660DB